MDQNAEILKKAISGSLKIIEQDRERGIISRRFGLNGFVLTRALEAYAAPGVSVNVAELPEPFTGREAIVVAVRQSNALGVRPRFHVESFQVSLEGRLARVNADVVTSVRPEVPELRRPRHSVATLEKHGDGFRLLSAEIGPETRDQPEARP